ncbi:hypothetical protein J40TS1_46420 [Paenibacillus montaniterrae]|uniref:Transposase n=1 Tax=Paenibacillus montaniterrae TaxID=429341 RepID=A0A919YT50_9BACL|nr:transposase [Paenibacillus montaniterrae]GIP19000.1 hypothetical protein J40TS1_46420 [Paenibacillus montaniterrae]
MKRYDKAFKEEAVRLSHEVGPKKAAEQLGISYYTLQEWRKRKNLHGEEAHIGSGHAYATANKTTREMELEKEIVELRRVNEILKDALGFFAKDRKR